MREEEKVARDVYLVFGEQWGHMVFENIAKSEQKHMDALKVLLDAYGIADPIIDDTVGVFGNPDLEGLYDSLTNDGAGSSDLMEALVAGGLIEVTDILDLQESIERTENADIIARYENLLCGSRNHLRAFVNQIELLGGEWVPDADLMSMEDFNVIVDSPTERRCGSSKQGNGNGKGGKGKGNGTGNCSGTGECTGTGSGPGAKNGNGNG
jgi:hypothetical protein